MQSTNIFVLYCYMMYKPIGKSVGYEKGILTPVSSHQLYSK